MQELTREDYMRLHRRRYRSTKSYPMDEWLVPGTQRLLEAGVDFDCEVDTIRALLSRNARERGLVISTARHGVNGRDVLLRVLSPSEAVVALATDARRRSPR
jgi:hypothetical protein